MAPNKLEDRIREQLQEREIQPSKDAWSKMEARLGDETKTTGNNRFWYAIAAGFVGILILASVFFNGSGDQNDLVVEDKKVKIPAEVDTRIEPDMIQAPEIASTEEDLTQDVEKEVAVEETKEEIASNKIRKVTEKRPEPSPVIAEVDKKEDSKEDKAIEDEQIIKIPEFEEESFIQSKVDEVVAEVGKIQDSGKEVNAEDIDQLLLNAQKEISKRRILNSPKKVDASALLSDVETELERGFRDKVFDALGDGFDKIRTAVAERNY